MVNSGVGVICLDAMLRGTPEPRPQSSELRRLGCFHRTPRLATGRAVGFEILDRSNALRMLGSRCACDRLHTLSRRVPAHIDEELE
jgi:hypothetical protein